MERHSSKAMFISEIPVRYISSTGNDEKVIKWVNNLNHRTTARDIVQSILPTCDPESYALCIHADRKKQILPDSSRIYKVVAKINQQKYSHRLLFEIQSKKAKKRVRFADEIIIQTIVHGQYISNEKVTKNIIETIAMPFEKRLENLKENFQKHIYQQQENYMKLSFHSKRVSLNRIHENIPRSSSESGISSNSSTDDFVVPTKAILETLV